MGILFIAMNCRFEGRALHGNTVRCAPLTTARKNEDATRCLTPADRVYTSVGAKVHVEIPAIRPADVGDSDTLALGTNIHHRAKVS